jgi:hypothetical protein
MAASKSFIGATLAVSVGLPVNFNSAGYGSMPWTTVGQVESIDPTGDMTSAIEFTPLATGRKERAAGEIDGGQNKVTYRYDSADAGQTILSTNNNTDNPVSWRLTDPDGKIEYCSGSVWNREAMARNKSNYKGFTQLLNANYAIVYV